MTTGFRQFDVTDDVTVKARRLGMYGKVAERVAWMARHSVPLRHQRGNRRYEHYVMRIDDGVVVDIDVLATDEKTAMTVAGPPSGPRPRPGRRTLRLTDDEDALRRIAGGLAGNR